jgi:hypothetical protein
MICSYCGKENPENIEICEFCGGPLMNAGGGSADQPYSPEPKYTVVQSTPNSEILPTEPDVEVPHYAPEVEVLPPAQAASPPQAPRGIYGNRIWWIIGCFVLVFLLLCCAVGTLGIISFFNKSVSLQPTTVPSTLEAIAVITTAPDPNQGLLLSDDFSDLNSGWDRADETDYLSDYFNGSYRILVKTDMSDSWANPGSNNFNNVSIEVDTTKNGGPDDNDFGVICRYLNADQFYYAIISSDGYYGITKVTSASSDLIGNTDLLPSDTINQGFASNHIRFDCIGDVLTLYVNPGMSA